MKKTILKWSLPLAILFSSCSHDDTVPSLPAIKAAKGLYVLSEGGTESHLGYYDLTTGAFTGDFFKQQNGGASLGQIGNDMIQYGSKVYIVMNASSNVTVINTSNAQLIKRIDFINGAAKTSPRFAMAYNGKVYVTATKDSSVSVIDTTSLNIVKTISVGPNPEGMAIVGNNLYVANSGGYNFVSGPDSTVSVVDLSAQQEIKRIKTGTLNPQKIEANSEGNLYVSGYGNFAAVPASVSVINSTSNTFMNKLGTDISYPFLRMYHDTAYFYNNYGGNGTARVYNTLMNTTIRQEFITDGTTITTPYGINIDEQNGNIYVMDAKDYVSSGSVTCFDRSGKKLFTFSVSPGVNPNKVLFIR